MSEYENESFRIDNDRLADWAVKKIAEADAEYNRLEDWYKRQLDIAKVHRDSEINYFTMKLQEYFGTVPVHETKTMKKYALPSGELVFTKEKRDFAAENPEALLDWCRMNEPELIKTKLEPAWASIKKRLAVTEAGVVDTETGLVVNGVVELNKPAEFKVKTKEAE